MTIEGVLLVAARDRYFVIFARRMQASLVSDDERRTLLVGNVNSDDALRRRGRFRDPSMPAR